jgi:hypothetical protein
MAAVAVAVADVPQFPVRAKELLQEYGVIGVVQVVEMAPHVMTWMNAVIVMTNASTNFGEPVMVLVRVMPS